MNRLTDTQIRYLIEAPKELPPDYEARLKRFTVRQKHKRAALEIDSPDGRFVIRLRENTLNPFNFSAILGYQIPGTNRLFRLRRYNGTHGPHTNPIEDEKIDGCHIHEATERYQDLDSDYPDAYAEETKRYSTLDQAVSCLLKDCGFRPPSQAQIEMFGTGQWT